MALVKSILKILSILIVTYAISFLTLSKPFLIRQLATDSNSTFNEFRWTNRIEIVSPFDQQDLKRFENYFKIEDPIVTYKKINFDKDESHFDNDSRYYYIFFPQSERFSLFPITTIEEYEKIEEYAAAWEKKFIWCFFLWIKISDEMTGIS